MNKKKKKNSISKIQPTKRGRPRIGEVREKPWLKEFPPMSRATWYRRQAEKNGAKNGK